jgi:hypothetical protein
MKDGGTTVEAPGYNSLLSRHLSEGFSLVPKEDTFDIVENDVIIGNVKVYPGTVKYVDLRNGRIYHADITEHSLSTIDRLHTNGLEIPSNAGIDIYGIAKELSGRSTRELEVRHNPPTRPNLLERLLPSKPTPEQIEIVQELSTITSLKELLDKIFPGRRDLSLVDVGAGYGEFALALAKQKLELGIAEIKATDLHPELMESNLEGLNAAGVIVEKFDAVGDTPEDVCDIVTLNAPQVYGKNAFAAPAISNSLKMLRIPGILLLRLNEASNDVFTDLYDLSLQDQMGVKVKILDGLPPSIFARKFFGKCASPTYVIVKK